MNLPADQRSTYSIIIPCTDSPLIANILSLLQPQLAKRAGGEVFVLGSDRHKLVRENDLVHFIPTEPEFTCASDKRNLGLRLARGDIFLFLDDDCLPAGDWLEQHLARHAQGELVVGGAVRFSDRHYIQLSDNVSAFHDLLPFTAAGPRDYLSTANLSVHRRVVAHAGELPAGRIRAEDLEWTVHFRQLGYRLYFEPQALVTHDPARRNLAALYQHWAKDAPHTLRVRLHYAAWLHTPSLARYRPLYLWAAPVIAAWATRRTFNHWLTLRQYGHTLPLVYLTKLIWCFSAYQHFPFTCQPAP